MNDSDKFQQLGLDDLEAVSYTHLDVYKRQVLLRSARSLPEDDAVSMVLVRQEGTSTEDLLRQLQDDPRILSAEPNYVQRLDDPDQTALDESTPQVAAALGLESSDAAPSAPASADASGTAAADLSGYQWGCRNTGDCLLYTSRCV